MMSYLIGWTNEPKNEEPNLLTGQVNAFLCSRFPHHRGLYCNAFGWFICLATSSTRLPAYLLASSSGEWHYKFDLSLSLDAGRHGSLVIVSWVVTRRSSSFDHPPPPPPVVDHLVSKSECPYSVSRLQLYVVSNCWRPIVIQMACNWKAYSTSLQVISP